MLPGGAVREDRRRGVQAQGLTGIGLRGRMIEEMQLRTFSEHTIESDVRAVVQLAGYWWKSPEQIGEEEVSEYFLHLKNRKRLARATSTIALCGIKFFLRGKHFGCISRSGDIAEMPHWPFGLTLNGGASYPRTYEC
jgi:hypothetical protein